MTLQERIQQDTITAMKERAQLKLDVLRMVKSAIKNKEIEKREPLTEPEVLQTLTTLIKQRRDSIDAFTKGNRPELAEKKPPRSRSSKPTCRSRRTSQRSARWSKPPSRR